MTEKKIKFNYTAKIESVQDAWNMGWK